MSDTRDRETRIVPSVETTIAWRERFDKYMRLAATAGPYSAVSQNGEIAEAMSTILWKHKCATYNKQTECTHRKGGGFRGRCYARATSVDYAVTEHTFIDGRTRLKCMLCGTEAYNFSGQDFKFAYLRKFANRTTNCPSASEHFAYIVTRPGDEPLVLAKYPRTPAGLEALKRDYPDWNGEFGPPSVGGYVVTVQDHVPTLADEHLLKDDDTNPIKGIQAATKFDDPTAAPFIIVDGSEKKE